MRTPIRRLAAVAAPTALLFGGLTLAPAAAAPAERGVAPAAQCRRTLPAYPILRPGDRKPAVRTLQCSLNDVGVGPVAVDGFYGPQTKRSVWRIVRNFEGEPEHPYRINNGFWTLLFGRQLPDRTLGLGDHGPAVTVLQRALRAAGAEIVVDGDFGAQTRGVVVAYQKEHHVTPANGEVGENTRFFLSMGGVFGDLS